MNTKMNQLLFYVKRQRYNRKFLYNNFLGVHELSAKNWVKIKTKLPINILNKVDEEGV